MFQELAFQIAKKAHSKQVDKAGKDYILHPMKVASYMDTDTEKHRETDVGIDRLGYQLCQQEGIQCLYQYYRQRLLYAEKLCPYKKCQWKSGYGTAWI